MHLNNSQILATQHIEGPALVLAGAGCGKTSVLCQRIQHMVTNAKVDPSSILAITFTNYAAKQMKHRLQCEGIIGPFICTFHKLGLSILRECCSKEEVFKILSRDKNFLIYDEGDTEKTLKTILSDNHIEMSYQAARKIIHHEKNSLIKPSHVHSLYEDSIVKLNGFDLDDLIIKPLHILDSIDHIKKYYNDRWKFICVDEYQDTSTPQAKLALLMAGTNCNLFAVGDPDQAIYSWRGATIENIVNLPNIVSNIRMFLLDQNYRSCQNILEASNSIISNNQKRFSKHLWSTINSRDSIYIFMCANEQHESKQIAKIINKINKKEDIAVLYRTSSLSRKVEDCLLENNILYQVLGSTSFYDKKEIKDCLSYLKLATSQHDHISLSRIISHTPKVGNALLKKIINYSKQNNTTLIQSIQSVGHSSTSSQYSKLYALHNLLVDLQNTSTPSSAINKIITHSSILRTLSEPIKEREENINELLTKAVVLEQENKQITIQQFLDLTSLTRSSEETSSDHKVKLMTIHHAKGAEFDYVIIVGMEEGMFPHALSYNDIDQMEEERRLCYVAMTRAKKNIYLTCVQKRTVWGDTKFLKPSRFISEIPEHLITVV